MLDRFVERQEYSSNGANGWALAHIKIVGSKQVDNLHQIKRELPHKAFLNPTEAGCGVLKFETY
jgi:hypothetical protein